MQEQDCHISITTALRAAFPEISFRNGILLPVPEPIYPRDGDSFCQDVLVDPICLQWKPSAGASGYLVQISLNAEFNGPAVKKALVPFGMTEYCLQPNDILHGKTIYWRVIAVNTTVGTLGASWKSASRTLTFNCGDGNAGPDKCATYDIISEIRGTDVLGCCDCATFGIFGTWDCNCQVTSLDGLSTVTLVNVEWMGQDGVFRYQNQDTGNPLSRVVCGCTDVTQEIFLKAKLFFEETNYNDAGAVIDVVPFECNVQKKVMFDCEFESGLKVDAVFEDLDPCGSMQVEGCPAVPTDKSKVMTVFGQTAIVDNISGVCPTGHTPFEVPEGESCDCACIPNEVDMLIFEGDINNPPDDAARIKLQVQNPAGRCGTCEPICECCKVCEDMESTLEEKVASMFPMNVAFDWNGQSVEVTFTEADLYPFATPTDTNRQYYKALYSGVNFYGSIELCSINAGDRALVVSLEYDGNDCGFQMQIIEDCIQVDPSNSELVFLDVDNHETQIVTTTPPSPCDNVEAVNHQISLPDDSTESLTVQIGYCAKDILDTYKYVAKQCANVTVGSVTFAPPRDCVLELNPTTCMNTFNMCQTTSDCGFTDVLTCDCATDGCRDLGKKTFDTFIQINTAFLDDPAELPITFNLSSNCESYISNNFVLNLPSSLSQFDEECYFTGYAQINEDQTIQLFTNEGVLDMNVTNFGCSGFAADTMVQWNCVDSTGQLTLMFDLDIQLISTTTAESCVCSGITSTKAIECDPFKFTHTDMASGVHFVIEQDQECNNCPGKGLEPRVNIPYGCGLHQDSEGLAADIILVQLTENLILEGTAEAFPVVFDGTCYKPLCPPEDGEEQETHTVEDLYCRTLACAGDVIQVNKTVCGNWIPTTEVGIRGLCVTTSEDIPFGEYGSVQIQMPCATSTPDTDLNNDGLEGVCSSTMTTLVDKFYNDCYMTPLDGGGIGVPVGTVVDVFVSRYTPTECSVEPGMEDLPICCLKCCNAELEVCECPETLYLQVGCNRAVLTRDPDTGIFVNTFAYDCCNQYCIDNVSAGSPNANIEVEILCTPNLDNTLTLQMTVSTLCDASFVSTDISFSRTVNCAGDGCFLEVINTTFDAATEECPYSIIISNKELPCDPCATLTIPNFSITDCTDLCGTGVDIEKICCDTWRVQWQSEVPETGENEECLTCCGSTDTQRGAQFFLKCSPIVSGTSILGQLSISGATYCDGAEIDFDNAASSDDLDTTILLSNLACNSSPTGCHQLEVCEGIEICFDAPFKDTCGLFKVVDDCAKVDNCEIPSIMAVRQVLKDPEGECECVDCGEPVEIKYPHLKGMFETPPSTNDCVPGFNVENDDLLYAEFSNDFNSFITKNQDGNKCKYYRITDASIREDPDIQMGCDMPYIMAVEAFFAPSGLVGHCIPVPLPNATPERVYLPYLLELLALDEPQPDGSFNPTCYGIREGGGFYVDMDPNINVPISKSCLYTGTLLFVTDIVCEGESGTPVDFFIAKAAIANGEICQVKQSGVPLSCGPLDGCCCANRECTIIVNGFTLEPEQPGPGVICAYRTTGDCGCAECPPGFVRECSYLARCFTDPDIPNMNLWNIAAGVSCVPDVPAGITIEQGNGAVSLSFQCNPNAYSSSGTLTLSHPVTGEVFCTLPWSISCTEVDLCANN